MSSLPMSKLLKRPSSSTDRAVMAEISESIWHLISLPAEVVAVALAVALALEVAEAEVALEAETEAALEAVIEVALEGATEEAAEASEVAIEEAEVVVAEAEEASEVEIVPPRPPIRVASLNSRAKNKPSDFIYFSSLIN